jgi:predicted lactoylglutathione lyase
MNKEEITEQVKEIGSKKVNEIVEKTKEIGSKILDDVLDLTKKYGVYFVLFILFSYLWKNLKNKK